MGILPKSLRKFDQYTITNDSMLRPIREDEIKSRTNNGIPFGIDNILMKYLIRCGEVFRAYASSKVIATPIGPMEACFFVFQYISGDHCLVVATDGHLGNITQGLFIPKLLAFPNRYRAIATYFADLIILHNEHSQFTVITNRDFSLCFTGRTFIGGYTPL